MTQKDALLEMLSKQEWVCSTYFQASYLPEFRSLISRLNKYEGYLIIGEPCLSRCGKIHKSTILKRWQWVRHDLNGKPLENNQRPKETTERVDSSNTRITGQSMSPVRPTTVSSIAHIPKRNLPEDGVRARQHQSPLLELPF